MAVTEASYVERCSRACAVLTPTDLATRAAGNSALELYHEFPADVLHRVTPVRRRRVIFSVL